jgi:hypothetical protein
MPIHNQLSIVLRSSKPDLGIIQQRRADLGIIQQRRADVLNVLGVRFQTVPTEVIQKINKIEDPALLETLHQQANTLGSVQQFLGYLQGIGC